jgi:hypothetical protein
MLTVNLWDNAFRHSVCSVHGKTPKRLKYVRFRAIWDGITLVTDDCLTVNVLDDIRSRVTIGWLLEPRAYKPDNYTRAESLLPRLDMLLTHDVELIANYPEKVRFVPFGGSWIQKIGIRPKTESICQIVSAKNFLPGHVLRHQVSALVPSYGSGAPGGRISYEERDRIIGEHQFCVVIENTRTPNLFTEKLLDCFAVGTIPIYWGCPNISDFFYSNGMLEVESLAGIEEALGGMSTTWSTGAILENLERMRQYEVTEDWIYNHILKEIA